MTGSKESLNIIQINLHKAKLATNMFTKKFSGENFDVGLVQEPYQIRKRIRNITQCELLYKRDGNRFPRAAIVFRKGLKYVPLVQFQTEDLVAALVDTEIDGLGKKFVFCSGYHDNNFDPVSPLLLALTRFCRNKGYHLVYGCDANSHNEL